MTDRIVVDVENHVARVMLNRAEKFNAVDAEMFEAFIEVGATLAKDRSLRAVVLCGAGDNFCAGIDVATFGSGASDGSTMEPQPESPANFYQSAAYVWRRLPVPVIAALHGVVFGAGLQIALGADIRIAAPNTQLSIMEIKWGLIPDMALSTTLVGLAGYDKAADLVWSGRIVEVDEAKDTGLITLVADNPLAAATRMAERIAGQSPDAIRASKKLLLESYGNRDADLLALEAELQSRVMAASNHRESVAANLEKRAPVFDDSSI